MILAINTSTLQLSLALAQMDGHLQAECSLSTTRKHFGSLFPSLSFILDSLEKSLNDLHAVAVATGPGSFTGLRVGLSTAKGICHGLHLPLIGISSLEALANQIPCSDLPVTSLVDSRRGEIFAAQFLWDKESETMNRVIDDQCLKFEDLPEICDGPTILIGNNLSSQAPILRKIMSKKAVLAPGDKWHIRGGTIARLALQRLKKGESDSPEQLSPRYFRPPDIRPNPHPPLN